MARREIRRIDIDETVLDGKRLGRRVLHDEASRDYPAERAAKIVSVDHAALGLPLDQGHVGSCTANALCGARNSQPDYHAGDKVLTEADASQLYHTETVLEGQPWPPNDPGGSGLEVCKAAKQLGLIGSYRHAFGIEHALHALVLRPVIFGIAWLNSFDNPDPKTGVVEWATSATLRGGHEICADRIDAADSLVWFWQSWGDWGLGGRFAMTFDTLDRLLAYKPFPGDATVPTR